MQDYNNSVPEYSEEELDQIIEKTQATAEELHKKLVSSEEESGFIVNTVKTLGPQLREYYTKVLENPDYYSIVVSSIDYLETLSDNLERLNYSMGDTSDQLYTMVNSSGTAGSIIDASLNIIDPNYEPVDYPTTPQR
jgi:hypothetical protein